jgi:ADP-heptose:LPS heptosyltransferase
VAVPRCKSGKRLKILIYRFGQLGDTIVALPALWAIRRAFPEANLTCLTSYHPGRGYVDAQAVLPPEGLIDDWLTYVLDGPGGVSRMLRLWKSLRARKFDLLAYLVPRMRPRTAVWRDLVFFRSAGILHVIGQKGIGSLPPRLPGQPLPMTEHEADHLLQRLALSQIPIPFQNHGDMDLALTAREEQAAEKWLRDHVPGYPSAVSLVGIAPGGKAPAKIWPAERFAELGTRLISEQSLFPIVFGGPAEVPLAKGLIQEWGRGACAAGALDVRQTAAALAHCRLFVGNDTGAMHLAAAVRTPCVVLFAAQDWPGRWYPYGSGHIVLRRPVSCEGCRLRECTKEGMRCLKEITVEMAWEACRLLVLRSKSVDDETENVAFIAERGSAGE